MLCWACFKRMDGQVGNLSGEYSQVNIVYALEADLAAAEFAGFAHINQDGGFGLVEFLPQIQGGNTGDIVRGHLGLERPL